MKIEYGTRAACKHCQQDIEYVGEWRDRGGNRQCVPFIDKRAGEIVRPKTKHKPHGGTK